MTTRRLSQQIEYSQPVLYSHFRNRTAIVTAVAETGFAELTEAVRRSADASRSDPSARISAIATAYLNFADDHPAVYEAMFDLPTDIDFAQAGASAPAVAAFDTLRDIVTDTIDTDDPETMTELLWSSLHGLAALQRSHRLRDTHRQQRIRTLVRYLTAPGGTATT